MTRVWSDGAADETRRGLADRRYRRRARYDPRFCAGGGRDRLSGDRAPRPCARRKPRQPAGLDSAARPLNRPLPRSLRAIRVSRRGHEDRGFFDASADPAAAPDRARATIGIATRVSAAGDEAEWRDTVRFWKSCGVTHLTLANYYQSGHLRRIEGRSLSDHIAAMRCYWNAVADLL